MKGWALVAATVVALVLVGSLEHRDAIRTQTADAHTMRGQQPGIKLIHRVDHARRAAQGCRQRVDGATWPVRFLERHTSNLRLRAWVLRRWTLRASWKCGELRKRIDYENSARGRWIAAAEHLACISGGDPWPNCPDPHDGTGSWDDTKACEAPGYSWTACATSSKYIGPLQFDPMWRSLWQRFGIRC